jgi:uncharacterized repeat protein (TIGR03806 family)
MRNVLALMALAACLAGCGSGAPSVTLHPADAPPPRLSEWGLFHADGRSLALGNNVFPYDLNTPLFSDYALKLRTVWLPDGRSVAYREQRELDFPVGTIISKTFHYQKADGWSQADFRVIRAERESGLDDRGRLDLGENVLIETRLLVRYEEGWVALPYIWNAAQDDATLEVAGDLVNMHLVGPAGTESLAYVVPDANQCGGCHSPDHTTGEFRPLGPKAWQLNRPYGWWGEAGSQLEHWAEHGLLTGLDAAPPEGVRWSNPGDATLEQRAKAYLDANCGHCHNAEGAADTSALHLDIEAPIDRMYGICKTPVAVGRGSGDRTYDIYPGRPDESIVVFRMQHSDPAIAMPELGRSVVHTEGVALISEWIRSMNGEC